MATLRELKREAGKYGGQVIISDYNPYDQSTQIDVEAPDGKEWVEGHVTVMVALFYSYDKDSRYEAYQDLIERINYGTQKKDI